MKRYLVAVPAIFISMCGLARAEYYCQINSGVFYPGAENTRNWTVTTIGSRKPQLPSSTRASRGCSHSFNSLGALYRRPEILTGPKLGTLKMPARYRIYYESAKPGTDYIKMRLHFINGSERVSAIYEYKITVVDHPI